MPLPFLLLGGAAVLGLIGTGAAVDGFDKRREANDLEKEAQKALDQAAEDLDRQRLYTNNLLLELGTLKLTIYSNEMSQFVRLFRRMKNVDFADFQSSSNGLPPMEKSMLGQIESVAFNAGQILAASAGTAGAAAIAGFGAYGGVMALGTASTGTAISTLSGVAATNATLAWLGGGALTAGGYGMAGGMVVLGGLVAGPAILVGGVLFNSMAEKRLEEARTNHSKAMAAVESMRTAEEGLKAVSLLGTNVKNVLIELQSNLDYLLSQFEDALIRRSRNPFLLRVRLFFGRMMHRLEKSLSERSMSPVPAIEKDTESPSPQSKKLVKSLLFLVRLARRFGGLFSRRSVDFTSFSEEERKLVHVLVLSVQLTRRLIDAPLLTQDGAVDNKVSRVLADTRRELPRLESGT